MVGTDLKIAATVAILSGLMFFSGCAGQDAKSLLDRIEFDPDEVGCARIQGSADIGGFAGVGSTSAAVTVVKRKESYTTASGEEVTVTDIPDC